MMGMAVQSVTGSLGRQLSASGGWGVLQLHEVWRGCIAKYSTFIHTSRFEQQVKQAPGGEMVPCNLLVSLTASRDVGGTWRCILERKICSHRTPPQVIFDIATLQPRWS